ncbi:hypothetical protein [Rhizobium ruizarguesonis]|uniref:hypothetical protein n=1 Tax=Rhizobium ruizarguesonis TaxID=2081791 RepID=UPI001032047E|nr:hypothetical protein [Rhizobium ruizarguesonis]TAU02190.1 hypothetical protein ELI53_22925 [Rhizobium ruizarguesonis]
MSEQDVSAEAQAAIDYLTEKAMGVVALAQLAQELAALKGGKRDEAYVKVQVAFAQAAEKAGRLTSEEYVFFAGYPVEGVHSDRWFAGSYDDQLAPFRQRLDDIEKEHGLSEGQFWPRGDAPPEYQAVSAMYDEILDRKFLETLEEFGLHELADMRRNHPDDYAAMRESGRRNVFERQDVSAALSKLTATYEGEAKRATSGGAYLAAAIMLGSAAECRLMLKARGNPIEASSAFSRLPPKIRRRQSANPLSWDFITLIAVAEEATWLETLERGEIAYSLPQLATLIRINRNMVHPARYAKDRPFVYIGEQLYGDARASYALLCDALG